jgi:hypothetical protein
MKIIVYQQERIKLHFSVSVGFNSTNNIEIDQSSLIKVRVGFV